LGWKYYFVFLGVLVVMAFTIYFFYPETRGHTLEQMAVIFDGENAEVPPAGVMVERSRSVVSGKAGMEVESRRWEDS
jgi:H+/Cl- antiporter ClcA